MESITFPPAKSPNDGEIKDLYLKTASSLFSLVDQNFVNTRTKLLNYLTDNYTGPAKLTVKGTTLQASVVVDTQKATGFQCDHSSGALLKEIQTLLIPKEILEKLQVTDISLGVDVEHTT